MPGRRPSRPIVTPAQSAALAQSRAQPRDSGYVVRASELNSYAYCERAWWLRYVAGAEPASAGQARLDAGHVRHAAHGRGVLLATLLWRVGWVCAALAAAGLVLWLLVAWLAH